MAPGLVMIVIGLFLIFRTVVKDGSGKNLVDRITSL